MDSCLLPKNVITQQFYRIWFFWLVFLAIVTCVMMIIRLAIIFDAKTRQLILRHRYNGKKESTVSLFVSYLNVLCLFVAKVKKIEQKKHVNYWSNKFTYRKTSLPIVVMVIGWCWVVSWTIFLMCLDLHLLKFWIKNCKEKCLEKLSNLIKYLSTITMIEIQKRLRMQIDFSSYTYYHIFIQIGPVVLRFLN